MILIDTSVWIEFFNHPNSPTAKFLKEMIQMNKSICINGLIEMEILQGIRSDAQMKLVQRMLVPFQYYPDTPQAWTSLAAEIYRKCRKNGRTIRKSIDCIIAANAILADLAIFHRDRDFREIAKTFKSLRLIEISEAES